MLSKSVKKYQERHAAQNDFNDSVPTILWM